MTVLQSKPFHQPENATPIFGILAIRQHKGRRRVVDAGCVARCHGAFGIEYGGQLGELLDAGALPHGLVDPEGHFVPLSPGIGGYGGSLKDTPPSEMAATCVREAVARSGIDVKDVGHIVFGNVIHTDAHDHYMARVAGVNGGLPHETPALILYSLQSALVASVIARDRMMTPSPIPESIKNSSEKVLVKFDYWGHQEL